MQIARVIGTVVATQKHRKLDGAKLLLIQPLTIDDAPRGVPLLAIDSVGAGVGERVLVVLEGRAAGDALRRRAAPVDAAIVGIIDAITTDADTSRAAGVVPSEARAGGERTAPGRARGGTTSVRRRG